MKNWNRAWIKSDKALIPISCCKFNDKEKYTLFRVSKPKDAVEYLEDSTCPVTKKHSNKKVCMGAVLKCYKEHL